MLKLIVFDWDDVIILGSKEGYYNCYRETLKELGVVLDEKEMDIRIRRKWGQPFRIELAELLQEQPHLRLEVWLLERCRSKVDSHRIVHQSRAQLFVLFFLCS